MAPDAEKIQQQKQKQNEALISSTEVTTVRSLDSMKSHEICIDGVVYSLLNFDHPGGDQIHLFGGNDVTIQYKMIHPHHSTKGTELSKLTKVGVVPNYDCE